MTDDLKEYEKTIKTRHRFGFNLIYNEKFRTEINQTVFIPIAVKTFEKLGWEIVYQNENIVGAIRKESFLGSSVIESVSVVYEYGYIKVKSESEGSEMWDMGRNSKRVKLFIYAFQQTVDEFDKESLITLEKETERKNNWDDYQIPESLPQPVKRNSPRFYIPLIGGILTALLLGYIVAFLSVKFVYIIGLFEFVVAFLMGLALKYLIRFSNYTDFSKLQALLITMIIVTFASNQYFEYTIIIEQGEFYNIGFLEFIQYRIEAGLIIKSLNTGWVGLIISWLFQLVFTYILAVLKLGSVLTAYQLERVPIEVTDFVCYCIVKDRSENEIRTELAKKGWISKEDQDMVFESVGAMYSANEMNRRA